MPSLVNKKILLGVTGGIAAYKTPELVRLLVKSGADVQVIMTPSARTFVTAETLSVVSGKPVYSEFFKSENGDWNNHVLLGGNADLFLIAPLTANTLGSMAVGTADNLLLTAYLSAKCPVMVAPAMDLDMMEHETTLRNLDKIQADGCMLIEPEVGELASGLFGKGRMPEPATIVDRVSDYFRPQMYLEGKKVLITAGPTYENIDPVRFIGNHSSGKMGYAIADSCARHGAEVTLVSGPVHLAAPENVSTIRVQSASEMFEQCTKFNKADIFIMAAAVADFRPEVTQTSKIKKTEETVMLKLVKNPDILGTMAAQKREGQWFTGFALETDHEIENAREKLRRKNLDMIVLNSLNEPGAGFGGDTNKVRFIFADATETELPLMNKADLGELIVSAIAERLQLKNP